MALSDMLQLSGISKAFGRSDLFRNVQWRINKGDHVGLVGPNGAGKTTLMTIVAGATTPDEGAITLKEGWKIGYLAQENHTKGDEVLKDYVMGGAEHIRLLEIERDRLHDLLEAGVDVERTSVLWQDATDRIEMLGGASIEKRAENILKGLAFAEAQFGATLDTFSGGWQMRAQLARLLLSAPDILLLDEPNNHLDLQSVAWLEEFLLAYRGAWVVVSHDRYFLNRIVTAIAELTPSGILTFPGNFDNYLERREALRLQLEAEAAGRTRVQEHLQGFVDRFGAKASKARQAQSRVKQIERLQREMEETEATTIAPLAHTPQLRITFPQPKRSGLTVCTLAHVDKAYGDLVIYRDLNLNIYRDERLALVGPNGAGKSTLLKMLAGVEKPDAGFCKMGPGIDGYHFAQHQAQAMDPEKTILEELASAVPEATQREMRSLLGAFLFPGEVVQKKVGVLSGGEKARLALAKMLAKPTNLLLLDEPTNHLDLPSRAALEDALIQYTGTLVMVSHDRYFINRVATKILEILPGNRVTPFEGNFDDYLWKKGNTADTAPQSNTSTAKSTTDAGQDRLDRKAAQREEARRKKQLESLEVTIPTLERRIAQIDAALCEPDIATNPIECMRLSMERDVVQNELDAAYESWAVLEA